jgi:D-alanine-D-alanine ligase
MKINVVVLFGGASSEHKVSIASARKVMKHLDREKYRILPVYLTPRGVFFYGDALASIDDFSRIGDVLAQCLRVNFRVAGNRTMLWKENGIFGKHVADIDVVLPVVHGTNVEDGALQGLLRTVRVPFACPDVLASALGMDKYVSKLVFKAAGLPVLDCLVFNRGDYTSADSVRAQIEAKFPYPVIVKPVNTGSSIGIGWVKTPEELAPALDEAFSRSARLIVEPALEKPREINCSVCGLENDPEVIASECEELFPEGELLSFQDKYAGGEWMATKRREFPANLTPEQKETIQSVAKKSFQALYCSGVARVDFLIDAKTGGIYLNEINTIPGALSAGLWQPPSALTYEQMLDKIIQLALKKKRLDDMVNYSTDDGVTSISGNFGAKGI